MDGAEERAEVINQIWVFCMEIYLQALFILGGRGGPRGGRGGPRGRGRR